MKSFKQFLTEGRGLDSNHLIRSLQILIDDFKSGPTVERKMVPVLDWVMNRINQSIPDGDVTNADIKNFLMEPEGRKALKKSGMDSSEAISMIMDF